MGNIEYTNQVSGVTLILISGCTFAGWSSFTEGSFGAPSSTGYPLNFLFCISSPSVCAAARTSL